MFTSTFYFDISFTDLPFAVVHLQAHVLVIILENVRNSNGCDLRRVCKVGIEV